MADFEQIEPLVGLAEGGYQCNPNDAGNYNSEHELVGTNHGIAAPTYEDWIRRPPTKEDMVGMSLNTAEAILRQRYWTTIYGDYINDWQVCWIIYDSLVQHWEQAFEWTRQAIQAQAILIKGAPVVIQRHYFNLDIINALNSANQEWIFNNIKQSRLAYYRHLSSDGRDEEFYQGWLNRMKKFEYK